MPTCSYTTFSTRGTLKEPLQVADQALADCFVANYSQSVIYKDNITSIVYILQRNTDRTDQLILQIEADLTTYLLRFFDVANVRAKLLDDTDTDPTDKRFTLRISIDFVTAGQAYQISQLATIEDSQLVNVLRED
jgi:hypothetical protein